MSEALDFDYVIIGSGFGGSVAALRLREKGHRVCVVEQGRRFQASDFPQNNWDLRRYLWMPGLGLRGPQGLTLLRHVMLLHGVGLGGGSLIYTGVLVEPPAGFFEAPAWRDLCDWRTELRPHFETVRRTIGVSVTRHRSEPDVRVEELARQRGGADACQDVPMGILLGEPGEEGREVADPYLGGRGPARRTCTLCGGCMVGCRFGAKNTLDRNYLFLAEALGAEIRTETRVTLVEPIGGALDGGAGYRLTTSKGSITARGVVFAAGALGTQSLLLRCREEGALPGLSARVGAEVRINNEDILFVTTRRKEADYSQMPAAGARVQLGSATTALAVRFSRGSSFLSLLMLPSTGADRWWGALARFVGWLLARPLATLGLLLKRRWAERTIGLIGMQRAEGALKIRRGRGLFTLFRRGMVSETVAERPVPSSLSEVRSLATEVAETTDGVPQHLVTSALGIQATAHLFGGCVIGRSPDDGVVDVDQRVFGYRNLYICDGSVIPANPGTAPSLTIAALAERCMAKVPAPGAEA
jgi:cholesterol oxidase